jgi:cell wall-associated NlpC family hydrolase
MKSPCNECIPAGRARIGSGRTALLRYPLIGVGVLLALSAPSEASTRTERGSAMVAIPRTAHRQWRVVHAYERYLARVAAQKAAARRAVHFAYRQLGKPYRWGGAGPRSFDCSGLVMAAWRRGGVGLPHRADIQYHVVRRKVPFRSLRPGDLVFFSGARHVGIYVGRGRFVHAPHTGTVIQRGVLTGWRRRAFAGAARPGAPAYRPWPRWVRAFAGRPRRQVHRSLSVPVRPVPGGGPVSVAGHRSARSGASASPAAGVSHGSRPVMTGHVAGRVQPEPVGPATASAAMAASPAPEFPEPAGAGASAASGATPAGVAVARDAAGAAPDGPRRSPAGRIGAP